MAILFEMLGEYILDGFKVAIIVGAMLIGFIALMAGFNHVFELVFHISFQTILGYLFAPIAFIMGILSVFLVSFANFSSIAIIVGAIKGLNEEKGNAVARFGLKLLYGATLVSILSSIIVSLIL